MRIKILVKLILVILFILLCAMPANATFHLCTVYIERATPDKLILELWSTSQSTRYSVNINYGSPCRPWTADGAQNWVDLEYLPQGLYTLSWSKYFDENPEPGMEACINWTCQPEVVVIYWSQDYQIILDYLYLPLVIYNGRL